jgi:hypothetical protein
MCVNALSGDNDFAAIQSVEDAHVEPSIEANDESSGCLTIHLLDVDQRQKTPNQAGFSRRRPGPFCIARDLKWFLRNI